MTYDGLRVLTMAEDDSRCCFGLCGPPIQPYNVKIKTVCVFFHCAFDGNAPRRRNIPQKLKNNEKLNLKKSNFLKIENIVRIDAPIYFLEVSTPRTHPKYAKKQIF